MYLPQIRAGVLSGVIINCKLFFHSLHLSRLRVQCGVTLQKNTCLDIEVNVICNIGTSTSHKTGLQLNVCDLFLFGTQLSRFPVRKQQSHSRVRKSVCLHNVYTFMSRRFFFFFLTTRLLLTSHCRSVQSTNLTVPLTQLVHECSELLPMVKVHDGYMRLRACNRHIHTQTHICII